MSGSIKIISSLTYNPHLGDWNILERINLKNALFSLCRTAKA